LGFESTNHYMFMMYRLVWFHGWYPIASYLQSKNIYSSESVVNTRDNEQKKLNPSCWWWAANCCNTFWHKLFNFIG